MGPMEENHYQKEILRFAEKLQARNEENSHAHNLMIHGLLMIWKKRHPMDVKDMLISYVPHEERKQFLDTNE